MRDRKRLAAQSDPEYAWNHDWLYTTGFSDRSHRAIPLATRSSEQGTGTSVSNKRPYATIRMLEIRYPCRNNRKDFHCFWSVFSRLLYLVCASRFRPQPYQLLTTHYLSTYFSSAHFPTAFHLSKAPQLQAHSRFMPANGETLRTRISISVTRYEDA